MGCWKVFFFERKAFIASVDTLDKIAKYWKLNETDFIDRYNQISSRYPASSTSDGQLQQCRHLISANFCFSAEFFVGRKFFGLRRPVAVDVRRRSEEVGTIF